ncbi:MAG: hypothetical protein C5B52_08935 [Bacteroidetes bacterium]|nr:MAG: hypothetical protein C5B52_08935 [Bacteroidota bacterium]
MYNPFPLLNEKILADKIQEGKQFFVRQIYSRGLQKGIRASFLLRAYDSTEKALAMEHLSRIQSDPNAFLYDVTNPAHLEKLHIAAKQPFGFKIYYAGKKGVDWDPPAVYQEHMKRYIRKMHPDWRTKKGGDKIEIGLYEEYGSLFINLSYAGEEEKIPFGEIEKY